MGPVCGPFCRPVGGRRGGRRGWPKAEEELLGAPQLWWQLVILTARRHGSRRRCYRTLRPLGCVLEVVEQLIMYLPLGARRLLQTHDFIHKVLVRPRQLLQLLLELLEAVREALNLLLARRAVVPILMNRLLLLLLLLSLLLSLLRRGRFSADQVEVVLCVDAEVGMLEFPRLQLRSVTRSTSISLEATYARAIPWAAIVWPPHFVKIVLVQLADEAGEVAVFEVFRQDASREFLALSRDLVRHGPQNSTREG